MFNSAWEVDRGRVFENIGTWGEFLLDWGRNRTQLGAVGLLYGGTEVPISATTLEERAREIARRLDFYLKWALQEEWAAEPNTAVAVTSQQLIVKHWLKVLMRAADDCFCGSHQLLLAFLHTRWPSLLAPPYPRFVAEYLSEICHVWQFGDPARRDIRLPIQNLTDFVVPALCVWGLGYRLAEDHARPDAADMISVWLRYRSYDLSSAMQHISGCGRPWVDLRLDVDEVDEEANIRATLALFKLRHQAGKDVLTGSPKAPF
ncbi:hypothetical protein HYZ80_01695 [Candidatus Parcubacteria bacterium]|nr:hypothetical protein [Candidatus Parcubacteria bacterium]